MALDYRQKGRKWQNGYGPFSTSKTVKRSKLKASKNYQIRTYFAKKFKYGGKTYVITGKDTGKKSKVITVKTGGKKLSIKSVKISKVKQFSRSSTLTIWTYYGGYGIPSTRTFTYWYTTFKVTIRLRKKPGAKGIMMGTKQMKGNKKKYTTEITLSGKLKGQKVRFSFNSYQHNTYKGYSQIIHKKVKIK